ncbi:MAG: hypothetical protein ACI4V1_02200 [Eubacteriales bacterium]
MEGDTRITSEPSEAPDNAPWFADFADSVCSYWMTVGVPCHEFWYGDPATFRYYEEVHRQEQKHENFLLWLQGRYVYEAIGALIPALHPFSKDPKPLPYVSEPFPLTEEDQAAKEERERIEKYNRLKSRVNQWVYEQNKKFTGKEN